MAAGPVDSDMLRKLPSASNGINNKFVGNCEGPPGPSPGAGSAY